MTYSSIELKCAECAKPFIVQKYRKDSARFCSQACLKQNPMFRLKISLANSGKINSPNTIFKPGHRQSAEARKKMSVSGMGRPAWNKGIPISEQARIKLSKALTGKPYNGGGFKKGFTPWNKGIGNKTAKAKKIRMSLQYRQWRDAVFQRDGFTCANCFKRGGELHAHHVKPFALHPELVFEISNGLTLCVPCHKQTPTYGRFPMFRIKQSLAA